METKNELLDAVELFFWQFPPKEARMMLTDFLTTYMGSQDCEESAPEYREKVGCFYHSITDLFDEMEKSLAASKPLPVVCS